MTFFSFLFAVPWEFAFIAGSGIKSIFTGIDSSSDTAVSSSQLIYSFVSFSFYLFIYFIVIANIYIFQIDRLEPSFTDSAFRIPYSVSVSGFHVLVLSYWNAVIREWDRWSCHLYVAPHSQIKLSVSRIISYHVYLYLKNLTSYKLWFLISC